MTDQTPEPATQADPFPWGSVFDDPNLDLDGHDPAAPLGEPIVAPYDTPPELSPEEAARAQAFDAAPDAATEGDEYAFEKPTNPNYAEAVAGGPLEDVPAEPGNEVVEWVGMAGLGEFLDELLADGAHRVEIMRNAGDTAQAAIRDRADVRRGKWRPEKVKDPADLRREIVGATDDADLLYDMGRVFTSAGDVAKGIVGDLILELPQRNGKPRRSATVADGQGNDLKVTTSARTEVKVDHEAVDDVLVGWLLATTSTTNGEGKAYAGGVRDGIALLRDVLASNPTYRSTALDALVKTLGGANEDELAKRLAGAYGRVEKGEPGVKYERTPTKGTDDAEEAKAC